MKTDSGLTLYLCWLDDAIRGEPDVALVFARDDDEAMDLASKGPGVLHPERWKTDSMCKRWDGGDRPHIVTQYDSRYLPENMARERGE